MCSQKGTKSAVLWLQPAAHSTWHVSPSWVPGCQTVCLHDCSQLPPPVPSPLPAMLQCLPRRNSPQACGELLSRKIRLSALLGALREVSHKTDHFRILHPQSFFFSLNSSPHLFFVMSAEDTEYPLARPILGSLWNQHQPFQVGWF